MSDGRRGSRRKKTNTGLVVGIIFAVTGIITLMIVLFMVSGSRSTDAAAIVISTPPSIIFPEFFRCMKLYYPFIQKIK